MKDDVKLLKAKIREAKEQLVNAGPIHRKDLKKYIGRLETQLKSYERYHRREDLKVIGI